MDSSPDKINDLSQKAEYLINTSSILPKDKDKVSQDLEQLNNTWKNYKNEEDTARAR
jgi:vacuolar-type H+-ATPase subunit I/STV1